MLVAAASGAEWVIRRMCTLRGILSHLGCVEVCSGLGHATLAQCFQFLFGHVAAPHANRKQHQAIGIRRLSHQAIGIRRLSHQAIDIRRLSHPFAPCAEPREADRPRLHRQKRPRERRHRQTSAQACCRRGRPLGRRPCPRGLLQAVEGGVVRALLFFDLAVEGGVLAPR